MSFNPDLNKKAQEIIFPRRMTKSSQPKIAFNSAPVSLANLQINLGIYLDGQLNFNHHRKKKMVKAMKVIDVINGLSKILPRHSFLAIYKSFALPYLD